MSNRVEILNARRPSSNTDGYSKARKRLPFVVLPLLLTRTEAAKFR